MKNWFEVDKDGLAKLLARRGKEFIVYELVQNCWDEVNVTEVNISLDYGSYNRATLVVEDNAPNGFANLSHSFTLFAESAKKADPEKRGRFNLGEKLVLALSHVVNISTTTGTIQFDDEGRHNLRAKREVGSRIECVLNMTREEVAHVSNAVMKLLTPAYIKTTFNGTALPVRPVLHTVGKVALLTEIADAEGVMRRTTRVTMVKTYEVMPGERGMVYEMGIPVVETGDKWHYDVNQKVPLSMERDSIPAAYLRTLRMCVLNSQFLKLEAADVTSEWVESAVGDPNCSAEAVQHYMDLKFGKKRVSFDPSDTEANKIAVSEGYTIVHGGMLSAAAWSNVREADAIKPAGQVTPSDKVWTGEGDPNAKQFEDWIPVERWTDGMKEIAAFARKFAMLAMHKDIDVKFCATAHHTGGASYGPFHGLTFNKLRMGNAWFEQGITVEVIDLLIHEFGHEYSLDHLSSEYYDALTRLGAKAYFLAKEGKL